MSSLYARHALLEDGWHAGVGVGLWFATLGQVVSAAIARGEDTRLYAWLGLPY